MPSKYDHWLEGDCGVSPEDEVLSDLISEYENNDSKLQEAAIMVFDDVEELLGEDHIIALYQLGRVAPHSLTDSQALKDILELANTIFSKMQIELTEMAEQELDARRDDAEQALYYSRHPEE